MLMSGMVTLTDRQFRIGLRSPSVLARSLRKAALVPIAPDTPRSPQGPAVRAELARYFARGRTGSLAESFDKRVAKWDRRDALATQIRNARGMLVRFQDADVSEPSPDRIAIPREARELFGVPISLGVDLAYRTQDGWLLRQLLIDDEIVTTDARRLYAVATWLHFEARTPDESVARVEIWDLRRDGRRPGWPRRWLQAYVPELGRRVEAIRSAIGSMAA